MTTNSSHSSIPGAISAPRGGRCSTIHGREHILPELPISEFSPFFNPDYGRPTIDLSTVMGVMALQQTHDLDGVETIEQLAFNIQWHYALNITEESDAAKYICLKTLWNIRRIAVENGLEDVLFRTGTEKLAKVFDVDTEKQRIDSVHIQSNMRRLGRISIFSTAIQKFLKNMKRQHVSLFKIIETAVVERYLSAKAMACFAMVRPLHNHRSSEYISD